jgi:hypothetical protein
VTVVDNTPPAITRPRDLVTATDSGQCSATVPFSVNATDNCDAALTTVYKIGDEVITSPHVFPSGMSTVTATVTDAAGLTASTSITEQVNDHSAPVYSGSVSTTTAPGGCTALVDLPTKATENCKYYTVVFKLGNTVITTPHEFPIGTTNVTVVATDSSGNSGTYTLPVTVQDAEPPAIACPADKTATVDPGSCTSSVQADPPTASDNCGAPTVSGSRSDGQPLAAPFPVGPTRITWTATDAGGNQVTCQQTVTVQAPPGTPADQVRRALEAAITQVDQLVATGVLRPAEGAALTAALRLALQAVNQRGTWLTPADVTAIRQFIQSFISGVNNLVRLHRLTAAQGAALTAAANSVLAALASPCP